MTTIVGTGAFTYEVDKRWGRGPNGEPEFGLVSGVACDSADRVYVFVRLPRAEMLVFDPSGRLLSRWGEGQFRHPHGAWMSPRDELYLTDRDAHQVLRYTTDGRALQSWGTPGQPGAPGAPFNQPTHAALAADGEMYVSDGYGQSRVHRFGADGLLKASWGQPGSGPGEFGLPHDVWVDPRGRVLVCDRPNNRIQHFDRDGRYTGEWADLAAPQQVFVRGDAAYIAEAGSRITVLSLDGKVLARWGSRGPAPEQFTDSPHSIWADSRGDLYVGEVVAPDRFEKFVRV